MVNQINTTEFEELITKLIAPPRTEKELIEFKNYSRQTSKKILEGIIGHPIGDSTYDDYIKALGLPRKKLNHKELFLLLNLGRTRRLFPIIPLIKLNKEFLDSENIIKVADKFFIKRLEEGEVKFKWFDKTYLNLEQIRFELFSYGFAYFTDKTLQRWLSDAYQWKLKAWHDDSNIQDFETLKQACKTRKSQNLYHRQVVDVLIYSKNEQRKHEKGELSNDVILKSFELYSNLGTELKDSEEFEYFGDIAEYVVCGDLNILVKKTLYNYKKQIYKSIYDETYTDSKLEKTSKNLVNRFQTLVKREKLIDEKEKKITQKDALRALILQIHPDVLRDENNYKWKFLQNAANEIYDKYKKMRTA